MNSAAVKTHAGFTISFKIYYQQRNCAWNYWINNKRIITFVSLDITEWELSKQGVFFTLLDLSIVGIFCDNLFIKYYVFIIFFKIPK